VFTETDSTTTFVPGGGNSGLPLYALVASCTGILVVNGRVEVLTVAATRSFGNHRSSSVFLGEWCACRALEEGCMMKRLQSVRGIDGVTSIRGGYSIWGN
jgi:hypothetical protein